MRPEVAATTAARVTARMRRKAPDSRSDGLRGVFAVARPSTLASVALGVMLIAAAALLYHETRGTTLWFDEWQWALYRRGNHLGAFLQPHNDHLSLVPLAIYRVLFATAGLSDYTPYRVLVIAAHLGVVVLVFAYARQRVEPLLALSAAALILFLGPAWSNIISPFQMAWLISLAAGLGALIMLDRRDRLGDGAACGLLAVSLGSSGVGVPIALGLTVDLILGRRRGRDAWIVAAPLAAYALWWLSYQHASFRSHTIALAPAFVADGVAGTMSALVGLAGQTVPDKAGMLVTWGAPLAVVVASVVIWRLVRLGTLPTRVLTLLTIVGSFWLVTALARDDVTHAYVGRYLYVGALFVVLLAVELARGASLPRPGALLLVVLVCAAAVSNVALFRDGGAYLRNQAQLTRADLGAIDIGRPVVQPHFVATGFPQFPFVKVTSDAYFATEKAVGSPAATAAEIAGYNEAARVTADGELVRIHGIGPHRTAAGRRLGAAPQVDYAAGGTARIRGACVAFQPAARTQAAPAHEIRVTVPSSGLLLTARGGPGAVGVRRFADEFQPVGTVADSSQVELAIRRDLAVQPWHVRLAPAQGAVICGLG